MSIPKLFAILIAAAMLFAPFAMQSGSAMAAIPSNHHGKTMSEDHCDGQSAADEDSKSAEKGSCAAMCAAVAIAANTLIDPAIFSRAAQRPALEQFPHGIRAKLPTPPPRLA